MKTYRKILAVIMCVVITLSASPLGGFVGLDLPSLFDFKAEAAIYSGTCGDNLTWLLDTNTGVFEIMGTGEMNNYSISTSRPWYAYRSYIKKVNIGDGVTSIGERAFASCINLTELIIGNNVSIIGRASFDSCDNLLSVIIPDSVITIDDFAFEFCDKLANVTIGKNVVTIGSSAFIQSKISNLKIPDCVEVIGDGAFMECKELISVSLGSGLKTIESVAFAHCDKLTEIILPDSLTILEDAAFRNCSKLKSIIIPDGITKIGRYTFFECTSLSSVTIPKSVTSIGEYAFSGTNISDVNYGGTIKDWANIIIEADNGKIIYASKKYGCYYISWTVDDEIAIDSVEVGKNIVEPLVTPKIGYTFVGWDNEIPLTMPERDLAFTAQWEINSYDITWIVDGVETKHTYVYGEEVTAIATPTKDGYIFIGWSQDIPVTMPAENITIAAQWKANTYTITWNIDDKTIVDNVNCDDAINTPTNTSKVGYNFIGWDKAVPSVMPSKNLEFIAQYELLVKQMKIKDPSVTTINYGETIVLHADVPKLPEGWSVQWTVEGSGFSMTNEEDGMRCKITSIANGNAAVKATLVDENGEAVLDAEGNEMSDSQQLVSKAGFFQKLISFFKNLFGISRIILQSFDY